MKKYYIFIIIFGLLLTGGIIYFIYFYNGHESMVSNVGQINKNEETINTVGKIKNKEVITNTDTKNEENSKPIYIYRNTFKNPFKNYNNEISKEVEEIIKNDKSNKKEMIKEEEIITIDTVKNKIPFQLVGIIGNEEKRIAVINTDSGSKLKKPGDKVGNFVIKNIYEDKIVVSYRDFVIEINIGGGPGV